MTRRFTRPGAAVRLTETILIFLIAAVAIWGSAAAYERQHRREPLCVQHDAAVHCVGEGR